MGLNGRPWDRSVNDRRRFAKSRRHVVRGRPWTAVEATRGIYRFYGTDESEDPPTPLEYRLMWYTDLLSSHRGTGANAPPSLLFRRPSPAAGYFFSLSSFLSLSSSLSRIPFLLLFHAISLSRSLAPSLSVSFSSSLHPFLLNSTSRSSHSHRAHSE